MVKLMCGELVMVYVSLDEVYEIRVLPEFDCGFCDGEVDVQ